MDTTTPPAATVPTQADQVKGLIVQLESLGKTWIQGFSGKQNHNPYLQVQRMIQPIVQKLKMPNAAITDKIVEDIKALPDHPPVINPDYVPELQPEKSQPQATPANSGLKNAGG